MMKNYKALENKDLLGLLINENSDSRTVKELMEKFDDLHELILRSSEEELATVLDLVLNGFLKYMLSENWQRDYMKCV